jgi:hypothetical protein
MIILLTVPGTHPIVAFVKNEDDNFVTVEYPVIFMKDDPFVYTMPYMPFADNTNITFSKNNIIARSSVHKEIEKHYKSVVSEFKKQKLSFKDPAKELKKESKSKLEIPDFKSKTFH